MSALSRAFILQITEERTTTSVNTFITTKGQEKNITEKHQTPNTFTSIYAVFSIESSYRFFFLRL